MAIGVFGASGFVGKTLIQSDLLKNERVLAFSRNPQELNTPNDRPEYQKTVQFNFQPIKFDLSRPEILQRSLSGITQIVYCIKTECVDDDLYTLRNLLSLVDIAQINRFVYISTAVVPGQAGEYINEDSPIRPQTNYQKQKALIEHFLINESGLSDKLVILRPTAIFGVGGKNLNSMIQDVMFGNPVLNYFKSCIMANRTTNLVPVEKLIQVIGKCLDLRTAVPNQILIVSCDQNSKNNYLDVLKIVHKATNRPMSLTAIPIFKLPAFVYQTLFFLKNREHLNMRVKFVSKFIDSGCENFESHLEKYVKAWMTENENLPRR